MYTIKNSNALAVAYTILHSVDKGYVENHAITEIKKEIRNYFKETGRKNTKIIKGDDDGSGYIELVSFPSTVKDAHGADEYFRHNHMIYAEPSPYDCTGQKFTAWYKIFRRRGVYMAYHRICYDV